MSREFPVYPTDVACPKCGAPPRVGCQRLRRPGYGEWKPLPTFPGSTWPPMTEAGLIRTWLNTIYMVASPHRDRYRAMREAFAKACEADPDGSRFDDLARRGEL